MLRIESLSMKVTRSAREAASSAATCRHGSTSNEWLSRSNLQHHRSHESFPFTIAATTTGALDHNVPTKCTSSRKCLLHSPNGNRTMLRRLFTW